MIDRDDHDVLAAELVMGLLSAEERAAAERLVQTNPAFAESVGFWEARLSGLALDVAAVDPPQTLWPRIERTLDRASANADGLLKRVRRWRMTAMVTSAIAAGLALTMFLRPAPSPTPPAGPTLVAQVAPSDARAVLLARYESNKGELIITPATISADGHSPELWMILDGQKPRSLGLVNSAGVSRIVLPVELRANMRGNATIAVSLEPAGGSPTGQPTGPVIAAGKFIEM